MMTMAVVISTANSKTVGDAQEVVTVAVQTVPGHVVMDAGTMSTLLSVMLTVRSGTGTSIALAGCSNANVYVPEDGALVLVAQTATALVVIAGR